MSACSLIKGVDLDGWGGAGRNRRRGNHNQTILYEKKIDFQLKKRHIKFRGENGNEENRGGNRGEEMHGDFIKTHNLGPMTHVKVKVCIGPV